MKRLLLAIDITLFASPLFAQEIDSVWEETQAVF